MSKKGKPIPRKSFLEQCLQWGVVGIFAILPLLYFPSLAASYVTSKQYFLIGAVDLLTVLWTWLMLNDARYCLTKKNLVWLAPLFLFLVSMTISAFVGVDTATSFFSKVESGTGLVLLYHAFLFTCIIASLLRVQQKQGLKYILQANLFASAILAVFTFFTGGHGLFQTNSVMLNGSTGGAMMGNSLLAGAYFIFSVFLTIILITWEQKTYKKIFYYIGMAVIIFSPIYFNVALFKGTELTDGYFFIGQARIATAALMGGLLISLFTWFSLQKEKKILRTIGIIGLIIGVLIVVIGVKQLVTTDSSLQRFFVTQSGNRIVDWAAATKGIQEKPLLGWGPENFHVVYQKYLDPIVFSPGHYNEVWALHPHSNTLEVLINGGIIGFLTYLLVVIALFGGIVTAYKKGVFDEKTTALITGMLIAFIIQQQMIYESIVSYTMFFLIIAIVAGLSSITNDQRKFRSTEGSIYAIGTVVLVLMISIGIYGSYIPVRKIEEFQRIADAHSDVRAVQYEHLFHSAGSYAINTDAEFYTHPLFFSYDAQKEGLKANAIYQKIASEEITALLKSVDPIWQRNPYDYRLSLSLVQLENLQFYLTGDTTLFVKADEYALRAFALSPTDPQIYTAYAQTLVYKKDISKAKAMLDKALELAPSYQSAIDFRKMLTNE